MINTKLQSVIKKSVIAIITGLSLLIILVVGINFGEYSIEQLRWSNSSLKSIQTGDSDVCDLLSLKDRPCKINLNSENYLQLCELFTQNRNECKIEDIVQIKNDVKKLGFSMSELKNVINRYHEQGSLDWETVFGMDLPTSQQHSLLININLSREYMLNADFIDYIKIWEFGQRLEKTYKNIPDLCRSEINKQVEVTSFPILNYIEKIKLFLRKVKQGKKSDCVVRGIEPLKNCQIVREFILVEIIGSQCINLTQTEINTLEQDGYTTEAKQLTALKKIFDIQKQDFN